MLPRIDLDLPIPPSVNKTHAKASDGQVYRRAHYRAWIKAAGLEIIAVRSKLPVKGLRTGPYGLRVRWHPHMLGDCSNRIKALEDFLVLMRITPDDRYERHLSVGYSAAVPGPQRCLVRVWSL